ncbi:uncharacterized protein METZ01_LOCUS136089 [marine metagenome]|uniref:Uncharacterized protein n=1 Tax=marine metagenome TaxID=408172 RepID=A0A381Z1W0_9ZZZZ
MKGVASEWAQFGSGSAGHGMLGGEKYRTHACMLLRKSKGDLPVTGGPRQTQGRYHGLFVAL